MATKNRVHQVVRQILANNQSCYELQAELDEQLDLFVSIAVAKKLLFEASCYHIGKCGFGFAYYWQQVHSKDFSVNTKTRTVKIYGRDCKIFNY